MKVYKTHGHPDSVKGLVPRRQEKMVSGPADRIFLHTLCKSMHLLYLKWYTFSCNFSVQGFFLMKSKVCLFSDSLWGQCNSLEWLFPSWCCVHTLICYFPLLFSFSKFGFYFYSTSESLLYLIIFLCSLLTKQVDTKQQLLERKFA